jgi:hypothetical protein
MKSASGQRAQTTTSSRGRVRRQRELASSGNSTLIRSIAACRLLDLAPPANRWCNRATTPRLTIMSWKHLLLVVCVGWGVACGGAQPRQRAIAPNDGEQTGGKIMPRDRLVERHDIHP